MNLIPSIMAGVSALYDTEAANVASVLYDVPLYFNHAPSQKKDGNIQPYPIVVYNVIDSVPFYSMANVSSTVTTPNKYTVARIQISVFTNENNLLEGSVILDRIEDILSFKTFSTTNNLMAIVLANESITFPDMGNKVYCLHQDYFITMGN